MSSSLSRSDTFLNSYNVNLHNFSKSAKMWLKNPTWPATHEQEAFVTSPLKNTHNATHYFFWNCGNDSVNENSYRCSLLRSPSNIHHSERLSLFLTLVGTEWLLLEYMLVVISAHISHINQIAWKLHNFGSRPIRRPDLLICISKMAPVMQVFWKPEVCNTWRLKDPWLLHPNHHHHHPEVDDDWLTCRPMRNKMIFDK